MRRTIALILATTVALQPIAAFAQSTAERDMRMHDERQRQGTGGNTGGGIGLFELGAGFYLLCRAYGNCGAQPSTPAAEAPPEYDPSDVPDDEEENTDNPSSPLWKGPRQSAPQKWWNLPGDPALAEAAEAYVKSQREKAATAAAPKSQEPNHSELASEFEAWFTKKEETKPLTMDELRAFLSKRKNAGK